MQAVNLLPAYARPGSRFGAIGKDLAPTRVLTIGGICAAVAALLVAGLYLNERRVVTDHKAELADTRARVAAVEAIAAPIRAAQAEATARVSAIQSVDSTRVAWEKVMSDLARVLPSSAYLQTMQIASDNAAAATPGTFAVTGVASSQNSVALVLDRLALLPWLNNITLGSLTRGSQTSTSAGSDTFTINAGFTSSGGAQ